MCIRDRLYDGCGNQPAGTNFPPHNGELCDEHNEYQGKPCAGDANGLFRNCLLYTSGVKSSFHPCSPAPLLPCGRY